MALSDVRVGLVGCGVHAREVLLPAAQRAGMELAAVCDLDKRLAQRTKRRFGAFRAYQDMGKMIDEMDLDAAIICGPPEMHAEAAEIALREGCHVFTEMPAAPTADEAAALASLAEERNLIAQPGLMMRSSPACRRLRDIIARDDFGEIRSIEVAWWPPQMHGHDDPLVFDLPHALDLVRLIGGDVSQIAAVEAEGGGLMAAGPGGGTLIATMQLRAGAVATVSFGGPTGCPRERAAVASMKAVATVEDRQTVTLRHSDREEISVWRARACESTMSDGRGGAERMRGFLPQMESFAAAVAGEQEPVALMTDAAGALRLAEHICANAGEMMDVG